MPFRLLGLAVDPSRAGELCGHSFAHYASGGVHITLACLVSADEPPPLPQLDRLGIRNLALLGFEPSELTAEQIEPALTDLMAGLQPHVVVMDGSHQELNLAAERALVAARHRTGGSAALPAKLYRRPIVADRPHEVTSAVTAPGLPGADLFARIYPRPWVTGLLERDLFAGVSPQRQPFVDELLAS